MVKNKGFAGSAAPPVWSLFLSLTDLALSRLVSRLSHVSLTSLSRLSLTSLSHVSLSRLSLTSLSLSLSLSL